MPFPVRRPRRLRRSPLLRAMVRETQIGTGDLIAPLFVKEGVDRPVPITSMPGQWQHSLASVMDACGELVELGVPAVILFGIPREKDGQGTQAYAEDGIVQRALAALRAEYGERLVLIADLCLCEYTDHGHCGVVREGVIDNDATLEVYARTAVSQARAGADLIGPSGMMDGQVGAIRRALDSAGFVDTAIMAYAAKYASHFYGPFREAAESPPRFGDRRTYQMDPGNVDEALREVASDIEEGADIVMVKPALAYLDVLQRVKQVFGMPTAAYNVSGEYAMIMGAAERGWIDGPGVMMEVLTAFKRAGADLILTYFARDVAQRLRHG